MIDDILFDTESFILETPQIFGGSPNGYSLDGPNYDFTTTSTSGGETSVVFIN